MSPEATAAAPREAAAKTTDGLARIPRQVLWSAIVIGGGLAAFAVFELLGVTNEFASVGLIVAAVALLYCLRVFFAVVQALSRPSIQTVLDRSGTAAAGGRRRAREERHRVLRAIKELDFDHAMGKISDEDFDQVRQGYEMRAIEVMRALKQEPELHPDLKAALDQRRSPRTLRRSCGACGGDNDSDAKFCKHCGEALT